MWLIIDRERMKMLVKMADYKVACIHADMEFPITPTHVVALDGKRTFTQYSQLDLVMMCRNGGKEVGILDPYTELTSAAFALANEMPLDKRTYEQLDKKAGAKTLPSDDRKNAGKHKLPPPKPQECSPEREPGASPEPSKPKPAKAASAPRTKGATGRVWELCEQALAGRDFHQVPLKELREAGKVLAEAEGINLGTFGVQFGKWKGTK